MGDADYMFAFQQVVMPVAHEFNPDLVMSMFHLGGERLRQLTISSRRWV